MLISFHPIPCIYIGSGLLCSALDMILIIMPFLVSFRRRPLHSSQEDHHLILNDDELHHAGIYPSPREMKMMGVSLLPSAINGGGAVRTATISSSSLSATSVHLQRLQTTTPIFSNIQQSTFWVVDDYIIVLRQKTSDDIWLDDWHANSTATHHSGDIWSYSAPPPRSSTVPLQPQVHSQGVNSDV